MKSIKKINSKSFKILIIAVSILLISIFPKSVINVKAQSITPITVHEAYDMINNNTLYPDLIILDVRSEAEYNTSHICNATLMPSTELESMISVLMPFNDTEIIVYCLSGGRSAGASQTLVNHGFTKVFNMLEGISGWISAGYEVCPTGNGQTQLPSTISFSFYLYLIILLGSSVILTVFLKKKISKK